MRTSLGKNTVIFLSFFCLGLLVSFSAKAQAPLTVGTTPLQISSSVSPALPEEDLKDIAELLRQYTATFTAQDFNAHVKLYHFPSVRFFKDRVWYFKTLKDIPNNDLRTGMTGDFKSSEWSSLEIIQADANKVHLTTTFRRLRKDGSEISHVSALYILEKVKKRWGIRASSVF